MEALQPRLCVLVPWPGAGSGTPRHSEAATTLQCQTSGAPEALYIICVQTKGGIKCLNKNNEISRDRLAELLNEDLSREYQAIIAYVVYSQVLKGAEYMDIAAQLEIHAKQARSCPDPVAAVITSAKCR